MTLPLERYLATVRRGLLTVPAWHRESELRELRGHLEEGIAARQATGVPEAEATRETLEQFGAPITVARGLSNTWWRARWLSRDNIPVAAILTLLVYASWQIPTAWIGFPKASIAVWFVGYFLQLTINVTTGALPSLVMPRSAVYGATIFAVFIAWQRSLPEIRDVGRAFFGPDGFSHWFGFSYALFYLIGLAVIPLTARMMQQWTLRRRGIA